LSRDTLRTELRTTLLDDDQAESPEIVTTIPQHAVVTEKWTTVIIHDDEQP
jgi:hypothetical protein